MNRDLFLLRIADRLGLEGPEDSEPLARAVLTALGEGLSRPVAETVAADLPDGLGHALLRDGHAASLGLEELHARISRRTGARRSTAAELAVVVCETLAEAVRPEIADLMRVDLPGQVGELIHWPEEIEPSDFVALDPLAGNLAEGRPGSRHPLSTAGLDRAQSESVSRSDNPHGETKLSSAHGLTQEREHRTLAEGHPGSDHPLSAATPGHERHG